MFLNTKLSTMEDGCEPFSAKSIQINRFAFLLSLRRSLSVSQRVAWKDTRCVIQKLLQFIRMGRSNVRYKVCVSSTSLFS